jgi:predicted RNase H-like HicB family nuclease
LTGEEHQQDHHCGFGWNPPVKFSAPYEQDGDGWISYVAEVPGANAQGHTLDEAPKSLREAVELIIATNREFVDLSMARTVRSTNL